METDPLRRLLAVRLEAERQLGALSCQLLWTYGKLMDGPNAGSYVSGIGPDSPRELVHQLAAGETVQVHLMHRHRSGDYEASGLRWSQGGLVMVFADREVPV